MYVELKNINKTFSDFKASDNVNFGIEKGKIIGLLGPSGSGKTTILRMIAGLENPDSGEIIIDGKTGFLIMTTVKGKSYIHKNVPIDLWKGISNANSKGKFYNSKFKGKYHLKI